MANNDKAFSNTKKDRFTHNSLIFKWSSGVTNLISDKKHRRLILVIIIAVQVLMLVYVGFQKKEYHIDEIYSYILSNSYDTDRISNADYMWNNWISGESFQDFVTVQDGEGFAYSAVYRNNSLDCHPPLFYWILHTICSFTPDVFSKWAGLLMNIMLFAVSGIFIYLISDELIKSCKWKFIPVIMWGFSSLAVDTCTFIRMYMLLTTITICFMYLHIKMFRYDVTVSRMLVIWLMIYLGAMTHYYSLLVSFSGVLLFSLYLLRKKEIKAMFTYGIGACISVGLMILSYPYIFEQATGSSTNNIGNEVSKNLFNIPLWINSLKNLIKLLIKNISYHKIISVLILLTFIALLSLMIVLTIKNKSISTIILNSKETFWIIGVLFFSFLSISFIGGEYVYLRYIYYITPMIYLTAIIIIEKMLQGKLLHYNAISILSNAIPIAAIVFAISNAVYGSLGNYSSYLFHDKASCIEKLEAYSDKNLYVIIEKISTAVPTGNLTGFELFDKIYMAPKNDIIEKDMISATVQEQGACVVYIATDSYWLNGLDPDTFLNNALLNCNAEYEEITDGSLGKFYYIHK